MRKLLCILALSTSLHAQSDFVALDKELRSLQAKEKTATPTQLPAIKQREAAILAEFNAPNQAKFEAQEAARKAAWIAKKKQEHAYCTAHLGDCK